MCLAFAIAAVYEPYRDQLPIRWQFLLPSRKLVLESTASECRVMLAVCPALYLTGGGGVDKPATPTKTCLRLRPKNIFLVMLKMKRFLNIQTKKSNPTMPCLPKYENEIEVWYYRYHTNSLMAYSHHSGREAFACALPLLCMWCLAMACRYPWCIKWSWGVPQVWICWPLTWAALTFVERANHYWTVHELKHGLITCFSE